jgi:hypothetical protein
MINTYFTHKFYDKKGRRCTICIANDTDNEITKIGLATCSKKDNFSRKTGRALSLERALTKLNSINKKSIIQL